MNIQAYHQLRFLSLQNLFGEYFKDSQCPNNLHDGTIADTFYRLISGATIKGVLRIFDQDICDLEDVGSDQIFKRSAVTWDILVQSLTLRYF